DGPLVHHVPRDRRDVLLTEPLQTRDVHPGVRRHARHPFRMRLAESFVAVAHDHDVARLDLHAGPRGHRVELLRRHRLTDGHEAFLAPGGHIQQYAARGEAVEVAIDWTPGGAGRGEAVLERAAVEQLTVPGDVAERVDVGDGEAVVDEVEAVE